MKVNIESYKFDNYLDKVWDMKGRKSNSEKKTMGNYYHRFLKFVRDMSYIEKLMSQGSELK